MTTLGVFALPGLVQWLRVGDVRTRELTLTIARELRINEIMLLFSWADIHGYEQSGSWGESSIAWLDETIHLFWNQNGITIYPRLFYTPLELCAQRAARLKVPEKTHLPPDDLDGFANFCARMIEHYAHSTGEYWQLGNEPNNDAYWSQSADPDGSLFAAMIHPAIDVLHAGGKKVVLGGIIQPYTPWLISMKREGLLARADALGIHAFPGTWNKSAWRGWPHAIAHARRFLLPHQEVWVTETGYSTVILADPNDRDLRLRLEEEQVKFFDGYCLAPAEKKLWYCAVNQDPMHPTDNYLNQGKPADPRAYHFGLALCSGTRKPLFYHWKALAEKMCSANVAA